MGLVQKFDMEKEAVKEAAWIKMCEAKGWQCSRCESIPPHGERDVYFETGMCGYCAHMTSKDD